MSQCCCSLNTNLCRSQGRIRVLQILNLYKSHLIQTSPIFSYFALDWLRLVKPGLYVMMPPQRVFLNVVSHNAVAVYSMDIP